MSCLLLRGCTETKSDNVAKTQVFPYIYCNVVVLAVAVSEQNIPKCSKRIFKKLCMCDLPNWFEAAFKTTSCTQIKKGSEIISAFQSQYTQISFLWCSERQNSMTQTITRQVQLDLGVLFCFFFSTAKFWLAECLPLAHRGSSLCDCELRAVIWCHTDSDAERFSHNRCLLLWSTGGDTCSDITKWGERLF